MTTPHGPALSEEITYRPDSPAVLWYNRMTEKGRQAGRVRSREREAYYRSLDHRAGEEAAPVDVLLSELLAEIRKQNQLLGILVTRPPVRQAPYTAETPWNPLAYKPQGGV